MKTILRVPTPNGDVDVNVEINESEFAKLAAAGFTQAATKTGYERVNIDDDYYYEASSGGISRYSDSHSIFDNKAYETANYYSCEIVANNNARADQLMRQLRRFAVEHREHDIDWKGLDQTKWSIGFEYNYNTLYACNKLCSRELGATYFDSQETAQAAINTFYDELIWYFTEYKDSL
jgi:hypothetical protein